MPLPVLVGVGRLTQRPQDRLEDALDPIGLAQAATAKALADAGVGPEVIQAVMFVEMLGEFRLPRKLIPAFDNPALSLARRIGCPEAACYLSNVGGNQPQTCINIASERIARGEIDTCLVTGAEAIDTIARALKQKYDIVTDGSAETSDAAKVLRWGDKTGVKPELIGLATVVVKLHDLLHDVHEMPVAYTFLEQAVRRRDGVTVEDRTVGNGRLFSGLSSVAASSENAAESWFPTARSADEIAQVTTDNRLVTNAYSKLNCAIMDVNQGASVLVMSDTKAAELGIPREKWVYLHGSADCEDIGVPLHAKPNLAECPGMRFVGQEVFRTANVPRERIDFYDVYSCFPIAVRMACQEMNLPVDCESEADRLTVIGGLPFHGGPGNNYVMHSIVAMAEKLRSKPGTFGLITANGGILSKHSAGIYSTVPYSETHPMHPALWERGNCNPLLASAREATPPCEVARNPGGHEGRLIDVVIRYKAGSKPFSVTAMGELLTGPDAGKRFFAKSGDKETVLHIHRAGPDAMIGEIVTLNTVDIAGKGRGYQSTFHLKALGNASGASGSGFVSSPAPAAKL